MLNSLRCKKNCFFSAAAASPTVAAAATSSAAAAGVIVAAAAFVILYAAALGLASLETLDELAKASKTRGAPGAPHTKPSYLLFGVPVAENQDCLSVSGLGFEEVARGTNAIGGAYTPEALRSCFIFFLLLLLPFF